MAQHALVLRLKATLKQRTWEMCKQFSLQSCGWSTHRKPLQVLRLRAKQLYRPVLHCSTIKRQNSGLLSSPATHTAQW
jgi:hypothetical protein